MKSKSGKSSKKIEDKIKKENHVPRFYRSRTGRIKHNTAQVGGTQKFHSGWSIYKLLEVDRA